MTTRTSSLVAPVGWSRKVAEGHRRLCQQPAVSQLSLSLPLMQPAPKRHTPAQQLQKLADVDQG